MLREESQKVRNLKAFLAGGLLQSLYEGRTGRLLCCNMWRRRIATEKWRMRHNRYATRRTWLSRVAFGCD